MSRDVTDPEGVVWTCAQAFTGLGGEDDPEKRDAARVKGERDLFHVVCTPSGGAASVRLQLPGDWETMPDDRLAAAIRERLDAEHPG